MSYDISLHDAETGAELEHTDPTYNYGQVWGRLVYDLDGKVAADTLPALRDFCIANVHEIGYEDVDSWKPTPANAMQVVPRLLIWTMKHPTAVWRVR